ncbi:3-phosphoshikimate 1-carboxyvinyltransferase [Bengtsoniella intestinalis]|uniref:3-phosphoshikimate 1-carboxyvinyltransferase n=1 Tax=Bengtsoniella intestinalis TaxID=3073143 RepID=UPI00391F8749
MIVRPNGHLRGIYSVPGDKSVSHRSVMFGALAKGTTHVTNFLTGADCLSTIDCFRKMGIAIEENGNEITIHGKGLRGLSKPETILDVGNSGTTTRLLCGLLSGQDFSATMSGDDSLNSRPMGRVQVPLAQMGAELVSLETAGCAPLQVNPHPLTGIRYVSPVASAQVKSAVLLAGLYAQGETTVVEPTLSRNHTELMLKAFGADIAAGVDAETGLPCATVQPCAELYAQDIQVPSDISSAAYFMAAGLLAKDSCLTIQNVGTNPTRAGMIAVCQQMGGNVELRNPRLAGGEPIADIQVSTSKLYGITIGGDLIPTLIDEIPVIAVMAAMAEGTTIIKDAAELKVKETNRIDTVVSNLKAMGADITATDDGMIIHGTGKLHGATIQSHLDHRIAMAFAIAGLVAEGETAIQDAHCVDVSFPTFFQTGLFA